MPKMPTTVVTMSAATPLMSTAVNSGKIHRDRALAAMEPCVKPDEHPIHRPTPQGCEHLLFASATLSLSVNTTYPSYAPPPPFTLPWNSVPPHLRGTRKKQVMYVLGLIWPGRFHRSSHGRIYLLLASRCW